MNSPENNNISLKPVMDFDRRNLSTEVACFPLIDSNGEAVAKERRLDASIYLNKIEIQESQLPEEEFSILFKQ